MSPSNTLRPHAEERPQGLVSKHGAKNSPFETARSAPPQGEVCEVAR
jgi:hypothetical protein